MTRLKRMGTLYLVRHAQASFLEGNYDKLSALGETQARLLGKDWARRQLLFSRACMGPRIRHRDTATLVAGEYKHDGLHCPDPQVFEEFDEYPGERVLERSLPQLIDRDQRVRELHVAFQRASERTQQRIAFQKLFEVVIGEWMRGAIRLEGVETWIAFCARVNSGLTRFLGGGSSGERVVIFTSGGPIAIAMQRALQLSPESTLQVSWMSRNSSWSKFLYSKSRFTLSSFNSHGHIEDSAMLTHR